MDSVALNGRWSATAAGTNSGATATKTAVTDKVIVTDHVSGHVDADSTVQLKDGSTVLAEWKIDVSVEGFSFSFTNPNGWVASRDAAVTAVIASSSADCQVNATGFTIQ
jgi:hypothetical protein